MSSTNPTAKNTTALASKKAGKQGAPTSKRRTQPPSPVVAVAVAVAKPKKVAKPAIGKLPELPKPTKAEVAAARKAEKAVETKVRGERSQLIYDALKIIVPLWFGQVSVERAFNKGHSLPVESALCLIMIGATAPSRAVSIVSMEMSLRPSGFDRREAHLLAYMGTMSLLGLKLVAFVSKKECEEDDTLAKLKLTAKGQKLFDLVKRSMLEPLAGRDVW